MDRRVFLSRSALLATGCLVIRPLDTMSGSSISTSILNIDKELYELFRNPESFYRPFIRWWWNGDKIQSEELVRELILLKNAGIGGVEINPIQFPTRFEGDDLEKPSLQWLSDEWIDLLKVTFDKAKTLGLTCDLLVGSGWPFGAEFLEDDERSQIVVIGVKKITGPLDYEISMFEIFKEADPDTSSPYPGRTMELLSLYLVPDPITGFDKIADLSDQIGKEVVKVFVPNGKFALYALVKVHGFMQVINGAPGATGPVLNHYNKTAVKKYLSHMSERIENRIGPLSNHIRALFIDSMELEGSNWSSDMMDEFTKRRGYDLLPYLPFVLFKVGAMGNITDFNYTASMAPEFEVMIQRMRYDFELTKAELLGERFLRVFAEWCKELGVKSRAQAYGRNFFPLESSFVCDIPECESWTMNWLKHKVGEEMPEDDYRRGRAYTMINKYVSSAANLKGKRLVSCEEMTDTYTVFNTSLENLKIGGDQSAITGVTHSIFHGFNYSPPEAPYPGWIRYGGYYNENNNWWPWFHQYNNYKGRLSSVLQNVTMFTDIAVLPPIDDMWSLIGAQMEPFPSMTHVEYLSLIWEAINKNGSGCDYISQAVICDSVIKNGKICYGPREYHTLFLIQVESLAPDTAKKLNDFVEAGGRIFCIETYPGKSLGWKNHEEYDNEIVTWVEKMNVFPDRFIILKKPEKDFIGWYQAVQKKYGIKPYLKIDKPDPFLMQNRYQADDGSEMVFIVNSHIHNSLKVNIVFSDEITRQKQGWKWDAENGNRYKVLLAEDNSIDLDFGPGDSFLFVFDKNNKGTKWTPVPAEGHLIKNIQTGWNAEFRHCRDGSVKIVQTDTLMDLKEMPDFINFSGTVIYRNTISIDDPKDTLLNLGKVYGISEVKLNGKDCGTKWYGRRIYPIDDFLVAGDNSLEIKVVTSMGNYMKSLTDNPIAQYWTNEKTKNQPLQSMGLIGPVTLYKSI